MNLGLKSLRTALLTCLIAVSPVAGSAQNPGPQRPTSQPYVGDLSIFEYPDRDNKLQIDRVMDLLGITPGKTVADIGAGSGWFTVRARPPRRPARHSARRGDQPPRPSTISISVRPKRSSQTSAPSSAPRTTPNSLPTPSTLC